MPKKLKKPQEKAKREEKKCKKLVDEFINNCHDDDESWSFGFVAENGGYSWLRKKTVEGILEAIPPYWQVTGLDLLRGPTGIFAVLMDIIHSTIHLIDESGDDGSINDPDVYMDCSAHFLPVLCRYVEENVIVLRYNAPPPDTELGYMVTAEKVVPFEVGGPAPIMATEDLPDIMAAVEKLKIRKQPVPPGEELRAIKT